jgi:hypothetical protein
LYDTFVWLLFGDTICNYGCIRRLEDLDRSFLVTREFAGACLFLVILSGCRSTPEIEPSGPIARLGSTPVIDGVFDPGEWDDAEVVRVGTIEQFRMKHDGAYLYFAVNAGGGDLRFNTGAGLRVLHWSAQLGSAKYIKSDSVTQTLDRDFAFELWGLQNESPAVVQETLAAYLAEHGWAANTASMGNLMQSELVVSLDWLGVSIGPERYVEIPGVRVGGGLMISRGDPREDELMALSREELDGLYPPVGWPGGSAPIDSIGMGRCPDTIQLDPADFGRIWIDLQR